MEQDRQASDPSEEASSDRIERDSVGSASAEALEGHQPLMRELADYRLEKKVLGEGAFAKVRLATSESTGHAVAVKIIKRKKLNQRTEELLQREVKHHERLRHANIVRLRCSIMTPTKYYLVMEYCPRPPTRTRTPARTLPLTPTTRPYPYPYLLTQVLPPRRPAPIRQHVGLAVGRPGALALPRADGRDQLLPQAGHLPPRPQAGEPDAHRRGARAALRQDRRLRPERAAGLARQPERHLLRQPALRRARAHDRRRGARRLRREPERRVELRRHPLRAALLRAPLRRRRDPLARAAHPAGDPVLARAGGARRGRDQPRQVVPPHARHEPWP